MSPHIYVYPIAGIISSSFRGLPFPSLLPRAGNQSSLSEQHRVALDLVPPVVKALALFLSRGRRSLTSEK
jgi:hypothetical protein